MRMQGCKMRLGLDRGELVVTIVRSSALFVSLIFPRDYNQQLPVPVGWPNEYITFQGFRYPRIIDSSIIIIGSSRPHRLWH